MVTGRAFAGADRYSRYEGIPKSRRLEEDLNRRTQRSQRLEAFSVLRVLRLTYMHLVTQVDKRFEQKAAMDSYRAKWAKVPANPFETFADFCSIGAV